MESSTPKVHIGTTHQKEGKKKKRQENQIRVATGKKNTRGAGSFWTGDLGEPPKKGGGYTSNPEEEKKQN